MNTAKELRLPHSESPPQVSKTHVVPNGFVKKHTLLSVDHQVELSNPNAELRLIDVLCHWMRQDASQVVNATSISAKRPSNEPDNEALKKKPKPKSAHCLGREVKNLESDFESDARTQDNKTKDPTLEPPTAEFYLTDDSEQQMTNISSEVQATDVSECQVSCKSPEISFETQDNETKDPTLEPPMAEFHLTGDSEQQMTNISSEVQATDVSECQVSCKSPEISFDEMAMSLLAKLEEDKASNSVRMGDFNNVTSNRYVDVGVFTVPESIHSYAKDLLANRPDIGTGNSPIHYVNEMAFVVLCCALKSMDTTRSSEITESLILKWRDAIRGALQFGFKVGFLKDHLRSAMQAHLAKSARNSHESKELQAIEDKITTMEKQLHMLKAHHAEMYGKMHSELRKTCEMAATKFSGETEITESQILKWRDAKQGALRFGFKALEEKIASMEREFDTLKAHRAKMLSKMSKYLFVDRTVQLLSLSSMTMMTPPAPLDQEDDEMLVPQSDNIVEGPQPMEVMGPLEAPTTVENQPVEEPPSMKFTWRIDNFTRMSNKKHYSDVFTVGGYKWRVLIFAKGNNVDHLSMYLDVADSTTLPYGWSRYAQFSLGVLNQTQGKYSVRKDTQHQFNARESDWGFTSFMPLSELYDPTRGYLVNDTVIVEAEVVVRKVMDYWSYDSKKETGYVGLKNQGATCYMNSLLQTLYHIPYFRKGTVVEGTIQQLFEGHHMNYIECINVDYKSTRKESFYDLQLDVKGCRDVYASFDKYVEVERLEGDNKYHAEGHGLQDAKKGVLFIDFPPVLQLQLKRFEYDFGRDTMVKINDRYEFPLQLDLDREDRKYLSPDSDRSVRNLYTLHSVLVHSGGIHGGHYYAFIRPTLTDQWYKFDDERVTKEDLKRALEEQYGGEEELPQTNPGLNTTPFKFTKYSNAYMLVYIRESDKDKIICNVDEKDIAEHLRIRLKKEQEEKEDKRRYKAQAHLYTMIKVARDEDLTQQVGRDIYFDLVDHDKVRQFRIQKQTPFTAFKEEVAKEFGVPVEFQRFWFWAKRQNHTYRPNRPLTSQEEAQSVFTVGQLREASNKTNSAELKLFLEVELGPDSLPIQPPEKTKEDLLLFFKFYNPESGELRYAGRLFVKSSGRPIEILEKLNKMAGFAPNEEIELYEEIKFEPSVMCEHLDKRTTFRLSQIEDGDIICFQKAPQLESEESCQYPDVPSFLEYVHNRQNRHTYEKPVKIYN
ncbi:hypothetical protein ACFE04_021236 [Oxalis oulophora]